MVESDLLTISVITPSFNQGRFIRQNIESVLAQGGSGWEHVIVDGGSDDDTVSILKEYPHLKWVSERDEGQADALNKAMAMSGGDLVFWINSDDLVAPGAFAAARVFFSSNAEASIVCGNAVTIDSEAREIRRLGPHVQASQLRRPWNGDTSMHQPSLVFRREVYDTVGPFDATLHYAMDFDFFLRAFEVYPVYQVPVDFGLFREHAAAKTGVGAAEAFREVRKCLSRHARATGNGSPLWTAIRGFFAQGCVCVNDAVACYERGQRNTARQLLVRGFSRYPPSLFVKRHLLFRARQFFGSQVCDRLRTVVRKRT